MNILIDHNNKQYKCNLSKPFDISIPLKNGDDNPNCFWADPVKISTIRSGDFVGSVAEGGSVNYQKVTITPHGNGTHTECYGHIADHESAVITNCLNEYHFIAKLISIPIEKNNSGEEFISFSSFSEKMYGDSPEAVIIRTLPNTSGKLKKQYSGTNPPFLDPLITKYMADYKIKHLLIDLPSVDPEVDGGKLSAHKNFWNMSGHVRKTCTLTELIYVDDNIPDGMYLLNLQVPSLVIDAVPSKPVIYALL